MSNDTNIFNYNNELARIRLHDIESTLNPRHRLNIVEAHPAHSIRRMVSALVRTLFMTIRRSSAAHSEVECCEVCNINSPTTS